MASRPPSDPRSPLQFGQLDAMSRADHTVLLLLTHVLTPDQRDRLISQLEDLVDPSLGKAASTDDLLLDELHNWIHFLRL